MMKRQSGAMKETRGQRSGFTYPTALTITFMAGITLRVWHLFIVGFSVPFNLGGLFHQMSVEIINGHFLLPDWIPYYFKGGLPFAYSPLPFYIQAVLIKVFQPHGFLTENLLPPLFSVLSLFLFYFLAGKVIKEKWGVLAAVLTFALIPIAFTEQIEAQGLSESAGTCAVILYTYTLLCVKEGQRWRSWIIPGVALGICVLSSPGSIYAAILISFLYLVISLFETVTKRHIHFLLNCMTVGLVGLLISAPYWTAVISHHGIGIYLNTFFAQTGGVFDRIRTDLIEFQILSTVKIWNVMFCLSLIILLIKKEFILFLFSVMLLLVQREAWVMSIPASLSIGSAFYVLISIFKFPSKIFRVIVQTAVILGIIIVAGVTSISALKGLINGRAYDISAVQIQDLSLIKQTNLISSGEPVIVVGNWGLIEWSPALLEREVINNHFGLEWMPQYYSRNRELSERLLAVATADEIAEWVSDIYDDLTGVYLVADRDYLRRLSFNSSGSRSTFSILQEFEELGLGWVNYK